MFSDPTDENVNTLSYGLSLCQREKDRSSKRHLTAMLKVIICQATEMCFQSCFYFQSHSFITLSNTELVLNRPTGSSALSFVIFASKTDSGLSIYEFLQASSTRPHVRLSESDYLHCGLLNEEPMRDSG